MSALNTFRLDVDYVYLRGKILFLKKYHMEWPAIGRGKRCGFKTKVVEKVKTTIFSNTEIAYLFKKKIYQR